MTATPANCAPGAEADTLSISPILESVTVPEKWTGPASVGTVMEYLPERGVPSNRQVMAVKVPSYPKVPGPVTRWPSNVPVQLIDPVSPPVPSMPEVGERVKPGEKWVVKTIVQPAEVRP